MINRYSIREFFAVGAVLLRVRRGVKVTPFLLSSYYFL